MYETPPQQLPAQPPECAGCGATAFGNRFWVPEHFPGVALCEACQFQQQQSQIHSNRNHSQNQLSPCESWEERVFSTNHEGMGKFTDESAKCFPIRSN